MKKLFALALALVMVLSMAACGNNANVNAGDNANVNAGDNADVNADDNANVNADVDADVDEDNDADINAKSEGVMTYAEYDAAALDTAVVVECYVQGHQSWWDNKITVYAQDGDGGYFMYEMACSEEDAAKLVPGTKIRVTGYKAEWEGEVEIIDGTFEILEGSWIAEATDVTALLGTEDLIKHQNKKVIFSDMTIEVIEYKNGEPGDDIYVTVSKDGASYDFCVERYLTGPETEVYAAFAELKAGDVVDIEGFLYWYAGVNTHITGVTTK